MHHNRNWKTVQSFQASSFVDLNWILLLRTHSLFAFMSFSNDRNHRVEKIIESTSSVPWLFWTLISARYDCIFRSSFSYHPTVYIIICPNARYQYDLLWNWVNHTYEYFIKLLYSCPTTVILKGLVLFPHLRTAPFFCSKKIWIMLENFSGL